MVDDAVNHGGGHLVVPEHRTHLLNSRFVVITTDCLSYASVKNWKSSLAPSASSGRNPSSSMTSRRALPMSAASRSSPRLQRPSRNCPHQCSQSKVGLENARDPFLVALERGPAPPLGHRRGERHVLHVGVLHHGVPAHVEHSGDLGPRAPGGIHRPYIIHCVQGHGHLLHPSRAGSPKLPPGETIRRWPRPRSPGRGPLA